jgi:two-component system, OmpR family, sensor histidine kinase KdpD
MGNERADSFLRLIRRSQRGRLKIYLGYAAGVGKTYQMLLEAHRLKEDGIDVIVGLVETHGRTETEALLEGLEVIPRRSLFYRGIEVTEMDLNAVIARHPDVVLVDELAHTNVPGSRNEKRYQDVEELLSAGIHVVSTLNIQHLESLFETVERATGVKVRERIPDRLIAEADQIVNVDITMEDLRRRLKDGKVYTMERVETALESFFKPSNLEQLRELTLRELAAQIDSKRRDSLHENLPSSPDQVMVCLSSKGPNSEALLRYASRLAGRLNRNWYAVYVQTSKESPTMIDAATQRMLSNNLALAQELGATVFTYKGDDIVKAILQFAHEYRVGHIVIGTPGKNVPFWKKAFRGKGVVERLVAEVNGATVVVLDTKEILVEKQIIALDNPDQLKKKEAARSKNVSFDGEAILSDAHSVVWHESIEKDKAIRQLLNGCKCAKKELMKEAWRALFEREKQGGTFVGEDTVIPHARICGLKKPLVAVGIGRKGILDRDSGRSIKIMILLLSPAEPPESHVVMLAVISRMLQNDQWRREVLKAATPPEINKTVKKYLILDAEI